MLTSPPRPSPCPRRLSLPGDCLPRAWGRWLRWVRPQRGTWWEGKGRGGKALFPSLCLGASPEAPACSQWGGGVCQASRPPGTPAPSAPACDRQPVASPSARPAAAPPRRCWDCFTTHLAPPTNLLNSVLCDTPPAASAVATGQTSVFHMCWVGQTLQWIHLYSPT